MFSFRSFEQRAFFWTLLAGTLAFVYLIRDFLQPIFWAALLATLFHSTYVALRRRLGDRASISAALTVLLVVVCVILPLALMVLALTQQSSVALDNLTDGGKLDTKTPLRWAQQTLRPVQQLLGDIGIQIDIDRAKEGMQSAALAAGKFLATHALAIGENALLFGIQLVAMLYVLFFFIRDGEQLRATLILILPLGDDRETRLLDKFATVANATIKGTFIVAAVQGALGGMAFWALGVPSPALWGFVMAILCLVPIFGAFLVWAPAALWLLVDGQSGKAIALGAFGALVIGLVDNFLRPVVVGRDAQLPDYVVLIATLGGIAALGASGFVIGPIAAALCGAGWMIFAEERRAMKAIDVQRTQNNAD